MRSNRGSRQLPQRDARLGGRSGRTGLVVFATALWVQSALVAATGTDAGQARFAELLSQHRIELNVDNGFESQPVEANALVDYEGAVRAADGAMEIRYLIRPLAAMQIDYDDPHGAMPDPNHIFPLLFEALVSRLSGGSYAPSRPFSEQQARDEFNADWAATAVFDVDAEFSTEFRQGIIVGIHRRGEIDAYVVVLYNDFDQIKPRLEAAMRSLTFRKMSIG